MRSRRVFLAGWFGSGNAGDEAICLAMVSALARRVPGIVVDLASSDPELTRRVLRGCERVVGRIRFVGRKWEMPRTDVRGIAASIREADAVIVGGGGLLHDVFNFYFLPFFLGIACLARWYRVPLGYCCVGVGPVRTRAGRWMARAALRLAEAISVRDEQSRRTVESLGVVRPMHVGADCVFTLERARAGPVRRQRCVLLMLSTIHGWTECDVRALREALARLAERADVRLRFLVMGQYPVGWQAARHGACEDEAFARRLCAQLGGCAELVPRWQRVDEVLGAVLSSSLVISMRYHGLVLGLWAGRPVMYLAKSAEGKQEALMQRVGLEKSVVRLDGLDVDDFVERAVKLLAKKGRKRFESKAVAELEASAEESIEWLTGRLFAERTGAGQWRGDRGAGSRRAKDARQGRRARRVQSAPVASQLQAGLGRGARKRTAARGSSAGDAGVDWRSSSGRAEMPARPRSSSGPS